MKISHLLLMFAEVANKRERTRYRICGQTRRTAMVNLVYSESPHEDLFGAMKQSWQYDHKLCGAVCFCVFAACAVQSCILCAFLQSAANLLIYFTIKIATIIECLFALCDTLLEQCVCLHIVCCVLLMTATRQNILVIRCSRNSSFTLKKTQR